MSSEAGPLRPNETDLILALLVPGREEQSLRQELAAALVEEMKDGGMGSLRFSGPLGRTFGAELATAELRDVDGIPLVISINVDQYGALFELDIWKVNFSPLVQLPSSPSV